MFLIDVLTKTNRLNFAQICNGNPAAESHVHWVSRNAALTFLPSAQSLFVISGAFFYSVKTQN